MVNRHVSPKLQSAAQKMPIIVVSGPRQSGKSTLVQQAFPNYAYVNLERPTNRRFAIDDPVGFLETHSERVIIDEVQYVPELPSYLQALVDEKEIPGRFVLTGSQNLLLMEQISQSLAGRVAIFNLLPFSMEELSNTQYKNDNYEDYLIKGFYPRIYDKSLNPTEWLMDYIQTYVERDVRQLINLPDAEAFRQFIEICAGRIGQTVNFSDLGGLIGMSYQTIKRWLSILKTSFLIYTLRPYHKNYNKRIVKAPKLYFYDTGLACALLNIKTPDELNVHFAKGALFENFVINEVIKNHLNKGIRPNLYYWRDSSGNEVDLILDKGNKIFPVEIKASKTIHSTFFKGLDTFCKLSGTPPEQAYLVYGGRESQKRSKGNVFTWDHLKELPL